MFGNAINGICSKLDSGSLIWKGIQAARMTAHNDGREAKELLKDNLCLKNAHQGERCFIVGNGPSLNEIDFSSLENEYVFTVNMIMEHPEFHKLKSNYHVLADCTIFEKKNEGCYLTKIRKLEESENLVLFVPTSAATIMSEKEIKNRAKYFISGNKCRNITEIDLCKTIPPFNKVIHYAIGIASYMGFSEIYLLGCEETGILTYINLKLTDNTEKDHCYGDNQTVKDKWRDQLKEYGMAWEYRQEAEVLENYCEIYEYCKNKGIKLINLTEKSLIDSIPQMRFEDII